MIQLLSLIRNLSVNLKVSLIRTGILLFRVSGCKDCLVLAHAAIPNDALCVLFWPFTEL